MHELSDELLLTRLVEMGGMPARINELPNFRDQMLRLVRSDLRAVQSYRPNPGRALLDAPLTVFAGTEDMLAPPGAMSGWSAETTREFRQKSFGGGHFHFLGPAFPAFAVSVREEITIALRSLPREAGLALPAA
jgi:surfactin synthase thioesterase subunit